MQRNRVAATLFTILALLGCTPGARAQQDLEAALRPILEHYETARAALANDQGAPVPGAARRIAELAARVQTTSASARDLEALRDAARRLARTSPSDLAALRRGFGEVSRPLIALLQRTPAAARGLHLFHCPMAEGYGEWVQPTGEIQNPYMGQRMAMCGTARDWR